MPTNILMPALSPTMEAGKLAKWLKKEGDAIKSGDVIAEIETDKATMEVEAVEEGTLSKILVAEGSEDVPVNQPIAVLLEDGEDASAADQAPTSFSQPATKPADEQSAKATAEQVAKQSAPASDKQSEAAPQPKSEVAPPKPSPAPAAPAAKPNGDGERVFASPLARRLAGERGIDLSAITGSGPHGRIVKADIEAAGDRPQQPAKKAVGEGAPAFSLGGDTDEQIRSLFEPGSYDVVPHDSMRRVIARRMQQSKVVVPHYYLAVDVDLDALMKVREEMNAAAPTGEDGKPTYKLSLNDFVIRALALTLAKHPDANASWTEEGMLRHKKVDIGVAVAIKDGLITPIIRAAETKSVSVISKEMSELAARARNKRLKPHEYQGGTTAISNLGMYGVKHFTAVVNPPHSTILAVSAGEKRAVVRGDQIVIATQMTVTVSCDHRVLDGAQSAEMMQTFKGFMEKPMRLLM
jgi:pyruvate dehydrogenase E2 component (dihydrolipoamide acetyltransferase)